jgi:hypothetical protein
VIPMTYEVPTLSGGSKIIKVKRIFQYDNRRKTQAASSEPTSSAAPETNPESHPLYRTSICKQQLRCPYKEKCWFAHGEDQLRVKPPGSSSAANPSSSGVSTQIRTIATEPPSVVEKIASTIVSSSEDPTQSGIIPTEQHSLTANFTKTVVLPQVSHNVSLSSTRQTLPGSSSGVGIGSALPVNSVEESTEDPFIVSRNGKSAPCGIPRYPATMEPNDIPIATRTSRTLALLEQPDWVDPPLHTPQLARVPVLHTLIPTNSAQFPQQRLRDGETTTPMAGKTKNSDRSPTSPSETNVRKPKAQKTLTTNAAAAAAIAANFTTKVFGSPDVTGVAKRGGKNVPHSSRNNNRTLPPAPSFGTAGAQLQ